MIVAVGRQRGFTCEEVTHQIQIRCRVGLVTVAQFEGDHGSTRPVIALFAATWICLNWTLSAVGSANLKVRYS
ncbi:MAG: hypothetical protein DMG06_05825 [Acidobacteria bacterium]|nr:MAG: hypothetical protein DMG06_05825 [Acidobacteriota bacterium]